MSIWWVEVWNRSEYQVLRWASYVVRVSEKRMRWQESTELCWGGEEQDWGVGRLLTGMMLGAGEIWSWLRWMERVYWAVNSERPFKYMVQIVYSQPPKEISKTTSKRTMAWGWVSHEGPGHQIRCSPTGPHDWSVEVMAGVRTAFQSAERVGGSRWGWGSNPVIPGSPESFTNQNMGGSLYLLPEWMYCFNRRKKHTRNKKLCTPSQPTEQYQR